MRPRLLALLLLPALMLGVSACGDDDGAAAVNASAQTLLKQTFGGTQSVKSGTLDLALKADLQGLSALPGPISFGLKGPFASQGSSKLPQFDFALTIGLSGQSFSAGAVSLGDKGYLKFQGTSYVVPADIFAVFKQSFEHADSQSSKEGSTPFSALGIDPLKWLRNPTKKGTEKVGGAQTVHIAAEIDAATLLADINDLLKQADKLGLGDSSSQLPDALSEQDRKELAEAVQTATFDAWTGVDDKILRRIAVKLVLEVPQSQRKSTGGLTKADIDLKFTIGDVNKSHEIKAPSNAKPLQELLNSLAPFFGGTSSGGGSSGSGSGSNGSGSATTPGLEEYSKCLTDAGSDITKAQKCAELLK